MFLQVYLLLCNSVGRTCFKSNVDFAVTSLICEGLTCMIQPKRYIVCHTFLLWWEREGEREGVFMSCQQKWSEEESCHRGAIITFDTITGMRKCGIKTSLIGTNLSSTSMCKSVASWFESWFESCFVCHEIVTGTHYTVLELWWVSAFPQTLEFSW